MDFILIENNKKYFDDRGYFSETFKQTKINKLGIQKCFVQDNHSYSKHGVIRGLHYQWDLPMDKLVRVSYGTIMDVIVDIRKDSKSYGKHYKFILSEENGNQLYVPAGYAHGFVVLSDFAHVQYKCTEEYNQNGESGINPLDKELNINWEVDDSILSKKDLNSKTFLEYNKNPKFQE